MNTFDAKYMFLKEQKLKQIINKEKTVVSVVFWENGNLMKRTLLDGTVENYDKDGKIWNKILPGADGTVEYYNKDGTVEYYNKDGTRKD